MENNTSQTTLVSLMHNPSQLADILKDPSRHGLDFYNGLSTKEKQYILFAAAAGLIGYAIYLGKQNV
ncbi:hypothetical protein [Pontibacter fetidus]|uniref:Uncharacterized protein n=1 Tax=Pontibacter fetidus TaxID=2700082 RepID=A0A6B2H5I8_9BACT|nr:hypothetical protein [Pontibacter fetidus]NDK57398.1 hypothetical protein [Pontibacter fetidus]